MPNYKYGLKDRKILMFKIIFRYEKYIEYFWGVFLFKNTRIGDRLFLTLFLTDLVTWHTMRGLIPPSPGRNRVNSLGKKIEINNLISKNVPQNLTPNLKWSQRSFKVRKCNLLIWLTLQGPRTQIDAFLMDILSWLNDTHIKGKLYLKFWAREIWYKTFNLDIFIFLWWQSLDIWKIQWVSVWFLQQQKQTF